MMEEEEDAKSLTEPSPPLSRHRKERPAKGKRTRGRQERKEIAEGEWTAFTPVEGDNVHV